MKKLALTMTATTLLLTGLAGCGNTNNDNVNEGASGNNRGFGVSEENRGLGFSDSDFGMNREIPNSNKTKRHYGSGAHNGNQNGDQIQSYGEDGDSIRNRNGIHNNRLRGQEHDRHQKTGPTTPSGKGRNKGNNYDHGFFEGKSVGQSYYDGDDGRLSREIKESLSGVRGLRNSHVIVHENDVIIAVDHDDAGKNVERDIKKHLKDRAGNRNVHVVTDRDQVNNVRGMNNRLEMGEPIEEIGATINDMLEDLGNAVQRPFERSR